MCPSVGQLVWAKQHLQSASRITSPRGDPSMTVSGEPPNTIHLSPVGTVDPLTPFDNQLCAWQSPYCHPLQRPCVANVTLGLSIASSSASSGGFVPKGLLTLRGTLTDCTMSMGMRVIAMNGTLLQIDGAPGLNSECSRW